MSVHVDTFNDLQELEDKLDELDTEANKSGRKFVGYLNKKLINLNIGPHPTLQSWYAVLVWRD
jgi:hypothetical protein